MRSKTQTISVIRLSLFAAILLFTGSIISAQANVFVVTNTNDSGPGSLRDVIMQANASPGTDTINFGILPKRSLKTIVTQGNLGITERVTINGWSEGGQGYDGPPLIELRAGAVPSGAAGLIVGGGANDTVIRGLIVN